MSDYSTRNIIDYAYDDDGKALRDALYAEIHDRVSAKFEERKQQIASNLVASEQQFALAEPQLEEEFAEYTTEEIQEYLQSAEFEQLDEIDRTALYNKLQAHIADKNKAYSADNAREFSGGKLRDPAEKKASLAKHVAGIRKAQGTLGKVTAQPHKLNMEEVQPLTEGKMDKMSLSNLWHAHADHAYVADQGWGGMHRSSDHNAAKAIENHVRKPHGNKCADDMCAHSEHHIVHMVHASPAEKPHHEQAAAKLRLKHGVKGTIYGEHEAGHRYAHPSAGTAIRT